MESKMTTTSQFLAHIKHAVDGAIEGIEKNIKLLRIDTMRINRKGLLKLENGKLKFYTNESPDVSHTLRTLDHPTLLTILSQTAKKVDEYREKGFIHAGRPKKSSQAFAFKTLASKHKHAKNIDNTP